MIPDPSSSRRNHLQIKSKRTLFGSVLSFLVFGSSALAVDGLNKISRRFVLRCSAVEIVQGVKEMHGLVLVSLDVNLHVVFLGGFRFLVPHHLHQQEHIHIVKGTLCCIGVAEFVFL